MTIAYDRAADVLYVTLEDSKHVEGEYVENDEGNILRIDPQTNRVVGFTIVSFSARLEKHHEITIPEIGALPLASWAGPLKPSHA
jgi:uncharacterized protein YuzE